MRPGHQGQGRGTLCSTGRLLGILQGGYGMELHWPVIIHYDLGEVIECHCMEIT